MANEIEKLQTDMADLQDALSQVTERRGYGADRRSDFQDWTEGVYKAIAATQGDVSEVKHDMKDLTAAAAVMTTDIALLKKDHEHAEERWEELKLILADIRLNGCDVYAGHRRETAAAEQSGDATPVAVVPATGRTWPDLAYNLTPTNIALAAVIAILGTLLLWHDKITAFLGF